MWLIFCGAFINTAAVGPRGVRSRQLRGWRRSRRRFCYCPLSSCNPSPLRSPVTRVAAISALSAPTMAIRCHCVLRGDGIAESKKCGRVGGQDGTQWGQPAEAERRRMASRLRRSRGSSRRRRWRRRCLRHLVGGQRRREALGTGGSVAGGVVAYRFGEWGTARRTAGDGVGRASRYLRCWRSDRK